MVSIICCTMRNQQMENIFQNYENQTWKERELIIIINHDKIDVSEWKSRACISQNVSVYKLPEAVTLGECLNFGIEKTKFDIIAKFDDDDYYSPDYLSSSIQTLQNKNIDLIGKRTVYMYFEDEKILALHKPGKENKFANQGLKGATFVFKKEICKKVCFPDLNIGEDTYFIRQCISNNLKVYSSDKFNYVCVRKSSENFHTWQINNNNLIKKSMVLCKTDNYKPLILNK